MCGRFSLRSNPAEVATLFCLSNMPDLAERYNVAPSQPVACVREVDSRELSMLKWGLIPSWATDPKIAFSLINARAETVAEKPAFRSAFRKRRCLVVADGFFEWVRNGSKKQPYHFRLRSHEPFGFAGLYESWTGPLGEVIETCSIITAEANGVVAPVHDRMPVILPPEYFDRWLDPAYQRVEGLTPLLRPYPGELMESVAVSTLVNSPRNEGPMLIEPADYGI
jgi:putative SOS response-associated peptidase YedK